MLGGLLATGLVCNQASAAIPSGLPQTSNIPTGRWYTSDHSAVIQISPCGQNLCGQIVGIRLAHPGDPMPKDWQGQPQCGLIILQTQPERDSAGDISWVGSVLDPRNGNVYHATISLNADGKLLLHGYLGLPIFGQTQIWARFHGHMHRDCKISAADDAPVNGGD
ncbi:MAG: DUF2147 domain-containing protein [Acidocella sp.]|nr:DUF2147 domain-containing protein [Acidocella sp.]